MKIDASAIETELGRILQSHCFRPHKTLQKFLTYVVRQNLKGADANITQQHIAVEALGKNSDFDPSYNPLIRVQAGRLRKQLEDYYATEGRFNPLRISLPNGSYQPVFTRHQTETSHSLALLEDVDPGISQGPSIVCIPRTFATDETLSWPFIARITRDYVTALTQFNSCQVQFVDETPWRQAHWPQDAWCKYGADFALFFDLHTENRGYSLKCSLVHRIDNHIAWAHSFALSNQPPSPVAIQRIFKRIAHDTVGFEPGIAHTLWARQWLTSGKPIAPHHQVMISQRQNIWDISQTNFRASLRVCEERLDKFPNDIQTMIMYADLCRADYLLKYNEIKSLRTRTAQVTTALMQQAPGNAASHLYYAMHCLFEEDYAQCRQELLQAQKINPLDSHLDVITGLIYMGMGDWHTGTPYIQASVNISPNYPDWYHIPLCISHYRENRYLAALREAKKIRLTHIWGPMLRTALYRRNQFDDKASAEFQQMLEEHPQVIQASEHLTQGLTTDVTPTLNQLWSDVALDQQDKNQSNT